MGVAVGDFNNDGFPDLFITGVGQNRLFRNTGKGTFVDVTDRAGSAAARAFSTSALWFDFDRDGLLDLFVCNYVKWSAEHDVFCSVDGKQKSYCTPEAYRGDTCWLFRNRGNGTFEDVTATSGIFDTSSKSLGVALLDYDHDGWPDLFVANDTQPNKLYRNLRNGTFTDAASRAGVAFSDDGKARAGMGVDAADFDNSGRPGLAVTNFDNEMIGLYRAAARPASFDDEAPRAEHRPRSRNTPRLRLRLRRRRSRRPARPGRRQRPHRRDRSSGPVRAVGYAQPPHLFLNQGGGGSATSPPPPGAAFAEPQGRPRRRLRRLRPRRRRRPADHDQQRSGRPLPQRSDRRQSQPAFPPGRHQSNRDAIGAVVHFEAGDLSGQRMVKSGSSYLSQSELSLTVGLGKRDKCDQIRILWPSGRTEEYQNVKAGARLYVIEGKGIVPQG